MNKSAHPAAGLVRPVRPLDEQLLHLLETKEPIKPLGAYDIYHILLHDVVPAFQKNTPADAALHCLKTEHAETLLRAYLAVLSPSFCHRTENVLFAQPTKANGRRAEISFSDVMALMNGFRRGVRELPPQELQPFRLVSLWSAVGDHRGTPKTRIPQPVDLSPSEVVPLVQDLSQRLSADWVARLSPSIVRDGFDAMLQTLAELTKNPTPVTDPNNKLVTYSCTSDVHTRQQPLPMVFADRSNPWLETTYHKQVLCILTFYKMFTIRSQVMSDCEKHEWPRDINARGFNIFHPAPIGPELLYQQCGVRLHMGDREHSQKELKCCSPADLQEIFGVPDPRLRKHLSEREHRTVQQILDFPFTLLAAYLVALRRSSATGEQQLLHQLFHAMSSEACLNLRFHEVIEQCREILAIKSVGQVVQDAYSALQSEVDSLPLPEAVVAVRKHLDHHGITSAWDDQEKLQRAIDDVDVRISLIYLGFSPD